MVLPIYAAIDRIPDSLLEASSDLGGRGGMTFRKVILPLVLPGLAAGSIFTFSLTLGDYIAVLLLTKSQFIGNLIYVNAGVANNLPLAAAIATIPVGVMIVYLTLIRSAGAFESL
jgi:putative spermidine/putrescine transport system permease protein